jgi:aminoglycoside/choline kinase family phosphotransferase
MIDSSTQTLLNKAVSDWSKRQGKQFDIEKIEAITPDASMRRYYRLLLADNSLGLRTVVSMVFDSVKAAEVGGGSSINADQAYLQLTEFYRNAGFAVPKIEHDGLADGVLIIEDLGDLQLGQIISGMSFRNFKLEEVEKLYQSAIDQIVKLQAIPVNQSFVFQRSFTREVFIAEMTEFVDFTLPSKKVSESVVKKTKQLIECLADDILKFTFRLSHRDFHSWNLMVDPANNVRIIDFQDSLMAPACYDLISLLNDRDTDVLLGETLYVNLVKYGNEKIKFPENYFEHYHKALLQRDLKVSGRFSKLVAERGLKHYGNWIPGTNRRIGRTLASIINLGEQRGSPYRESLKSLVEILEIKEGSENSWSFD